MVPTATRTDRQRDGRTDGRHNNRVKNHEADAVQRSICLATLVKRYNLIQLVWEGNRGSNPRMNLHCRRLDDPRPFPRTHMTLENVYASFYNCNWAWCWYGEVGGC